MKIAICDDEKEIRELLGNKVQKLYPEAALFFYATGEELLAHNNRPDILLLDIQMPGKNGMEIARELRNKNKSMILIFITAIEEYVFQAFDVGAFHYLVKPFTDDKFEMVLNRAAEQYRNAAYVLQAQRLAGEERYIIIKTGGVHIKVLIKDIIYAEVFNRKVIIHEAEKEIVYYGKLSVLEEQLGEDFFRPHRAYLVHFKYVTRYNASEISMVKGTALMAKKNYPEFVKRYMKYNQRKGREGEL